VFFFSRLITPYYLVQWGVVSLSFMAEAMWLMKKNNYATAARILESHLRDSDLRPSAKIGIMAWIAECHLKAKDHGLAARWFKLAGSATLKCDELMPWEKKKRAIQEFDLALSHYEAIDDIDGISRVATLRYSLTMTN